MCFFASLFNSGEGGLLIHCISGWDRTPLFISLLRMSLWAVRPGVSITLVISGH